MEMIIVGIMSALLFAVFVTIYMLVRNCAKTDLGEED